MRRIMMAVLATATVALAGAPASAAGSYGAALGATAASPVDLVQYYGGGYRRHYNYCRNVCVARDYYGRCSYYRRVCH